MNYINTTTDALPTLIPFDEVSITEIPSWIQSLIPPLLKFAKLFAIAIIVILIGRRFIKWVTKVLHKSLEKSNLDEGVSKFLLSAISIALNIIVVIAAANIIGLETGSMVALVGSAGLALGLALQGSLSNFAGGVLILIMKPFRIGDYIIVNGNEGSVTSIDIFYTKLLTIDNRLIVIPNGTLSNSSIVNVSNEPIRRLDLIISVDYSENIKKVKDILWNLGTKNEMVLKDEHPVDVFVNSFDPSAISIGLRVWVINQNYWILKWELLEQIKEAFDLENIQIPYNQLDVNLHGKVIN